MSVAVLTDVHGNVCALRAVLAEIDTLGVDTIVVGGDAARASRPTRGSGSCSPASPTTSHAATRTCSSIDVESTLAEILASGYSKAAE